MKRLALLLLLPAVSGCSVRMLETGAPTRGTIQPGALEGLRPGDSDRSAVLLLLGEPDATTAESFVSRTCVVATDGWTYRIRRSESTLVVWFDGGGRLKTWTFEETRLH